METALHFYDHGIFHAKRYNPALEKYRMNEQIQTRDKKSTSIDGSLVLAHGFRSAIVRKLTEHLLYSKTTEFNFSDANDGDQTTPHFTIFGLYRLTTAGKCVAGALVTTALAAAVYANYKICQKAYHWWKNRKARQAKEG
jgi:hypothetical protein